jgi:cell wall-associated NlpC family hydrolase
MVNYQSLIGRRWQYGVNDCFSLVRDFFGLQGVKLPDFERPADLETCQSIFLEQAERIGFCQVDYERRQPGDVLIMRLDTQAPMHAAVLVDYDRILHQQQDSLSVVEPLRSYYARRVAAVFRYGAGCPTDGRSR